MAEQFKPGDKVTLVSGSIQMVVQYIINDSSGRQVASPTTAHCWWYNPQTNDFKNGDFPVEILTLSK